MPDARLPRATVPIAIQQVSAQRYRLAAADLNVKDNDVIIDRDIAIDQFSHRAGQEPWVRLGQEPCGTLRARSATVPPGGASASLPAESAPRGGGQRTVRARRVPVNWNRGSGGQKLR